MARLAVPTCPTARVACLSRLSGRARTLSLGLPILRGCGKAAGVRPIPRACVMRWSSSRLASTAGRNERPAPHVMAAIVMAAVGLGQIVPGSAMT